MFVKNPNREYEKEGLFYHHRDLSYFDELNDELIERVVGIFVAYYKLDEHNNKPNIYNEVASKTYKPPVKVYCLISLNEFTNDTTSEYGYNKERTVQFRFHETHLRKANIMPMVGDLIKWNESYYEVNMVNFLPYSSLEQPSKMFIVNCHLTRLSRVLVSNPY